jgi:hypothetical protein
MKDETKAIRPSDDQTIAFLKDEWVLLQNQYEDFDKRSLTIKGWVSSGAVAALGLAFNAPQHGAFVAGIAVIVVLMVWYLEATWKVFQYCFVERITVLETFFEKGGPVPVPLQAFTAWRTAFKDRRDWRFLMYAAWQPFVCLPYVGIVLIGLASAWVLWVGGPSSK